MWPEKRRKTLILNCDGSSVLQDKTEWLPRGVASLFADLKLAKSLNSRCQLPFLMHEHYSKKNYNHLSLYHRSGLHLKKVPKWAWKFLLWMISLFWLKIFLWLSEGRPPHTTTIRPNIIKIWYTTPQFEFSRKNTFTFKAGLKMFLFKLKHIQK